MDAKVQRYKCMVCKIVLVEDDLIEGKCPMCKITPEKMCSLDKTTCSHPGEEISGIITYCEECGKPCCPICNCHDIVILSRITGYYGDVGGFNAAKAQELKDRTHYVVA